VQSRRKRGELYVCTSKLSPEELAKRDIELGFAQEQAFCVLLVVWFDVFLYALLTSTLLAETL